jgi:hypothetical protein
MPTRQELVDRVIRRGAELTPMVQAMNDASSGDVNLTLMDMDYAFELLEGTGVKYDDIEKARGARNGVQTAFNRRAWGELPAKVAELNTVIDRDIKGLAQSGGRRRKTRRGKKRSKRARTGRTSTRL